MLGAVLLVLSLVSVPLARGSLMKLADVRLRCGWALIVAIGLQIVIISIIPGTLTQFHPGVHVASYFFAGYFLFANRNIPGFWLIGLGGVMNLVAIVANGGTMPASASALSTAGLLGESGGEFENSAVLGDPNLAFLGDIFAVPSSWPFSNVFSLGDVCIALGAFLTLHRLCGSRLIPSGSGQFAALSRHPGFMRLWVAQAASNLGDYVYALAVVVTLTERGVGPQVLASLLIVQVAPAVVTGLLGAPLVDRFSRKRLMVLADVCRTVAVGSLLFVDSPSLAHFYFVAATLGAFGAIFQPSLQASIPNLVPRGLVVAANSLVIATFHMAVMAGPVIGATLAAQVSPSSAFALNSLSFMVSAILVGGVVIPHAPVERLTKPGRQLAEGFRYALQTPMIRGIFLMIGVAMFAASLKAPLDPIFILKTLGGRPESLGFAEAAWGLGMLLGAVGAPALARRWLRPHLLTVGFAMIGVGIFIAAQASALFPILLLWLVAGAGNSIASISYESLLQEGTPDHLRGRVVAGSEAILDMSLICGALMAGWLGSHIGIRPTYMISGALFMAVATFGHFVAAPTRPSRRRAKDVTEPAAWRWGSVGFDISFFERLELDPDHTLLLVGGDWTEPGGPPATPPWLIADGGASLLRLEPASGDFPRHGRGAWANPASWRAAFVASAGELPEGPSWALQTGDGALAYLPEPRQHPVAMLSPDERAAAVGLLADARRSAREHEELLRPRRRSGAEPDARLGIEAT